MFASAELGHKIDKETFEREAPKLREALLEVQYALKSAARFPVIVLVNGVDGAGKRIKLHRLLDQRNQPVDPEAEVHRIAVQVDLQVSIEPEHQRAPNASIIAFTSATSCPPHSSSTVTPLGSRAVSSAGFSDGRTDGWVEAGAWAGRHCSATGDAHYERSRHGSADYRTVHRARKKHLLPSGITPACRGSETFTVPRRMTGLRSPAAGLSGLD